MITGTNFVFSPLAELCPYQENTCGSSCRQLHNTSWLSSERLQATLPTDLESGEYCLAVTNPGGARDMLSNAFTISDAERRGFTIAGSFPINQWAPHITNAEIRTLQGSQAQIWAEVLDNEQVEHVWAVVYPPSYEPPKSSQEIVPEPPRTLLSKSNPVAYGAAKVNLGAEYTIDYTQFTEAGTYQIVIHAQDDQELKARPVTINLQIAPPTATPTNTPTATNTPTPTPTEIANGALFLPLVIR